MTKGIENTSMNDIEVLPTIFSFWGMLSGIIQIATVIIFVFYPSIRYTIAKYSGLIRFVEVHMASTLKLPVGIENFEEIRKLPQL